jgi:hypothetical protein
MLLGEGKRLANSVFRSLTGSEIFRRSRLYRAGNVDYSMDKTMEKSTFSMGRKILC